MLRNLLLLAVFGLIGLWLTGCGGSSGTGNVPFALQVAEARKLPDAESRVGRLIEIGRQQGEAYDQAGAVETLERAQADCQAIADIQVRTDLLLRLAKTQADLGDRAAARIAINSAKSAVAGVQLTEERILMLARVARAQGAIGDYSDGSATLRSATASAVEIDDVLGRTTVYCAIADTFHTFHQADNRDRSFNIAITYVQTVSDSKKRCRALAEIAAKQAELDGVVAATDTFDRALSVAESIEQPYFRAYALGKVAEQLYRAGFRIQARRVLDRAESAATKVSEQDLQLQALQNVRSLMDKLPKQQG